MGLAGIALASTMLNVEKTPVLYGVLAIATVLALGGAGRLITLPGDFYAIPREVKTWQPECADAAALDLVACVHPAYGPNLNPTLEIASAVWEPVAHLQGILTRIDQFPEGGQTTPPLPIHFESNGRLYLAVEYAIAATNGASSLPQAVVAMWLASQATPVSEELVYEIAVRLLVAGGGSGGTDGGSDLFSVGEQLLDEMDRLVALPPEERRAWLEANWAALRGGELDASDMPAT